MDLLRSMEVFAKVVELGSFIAASEALGISRPMASKHVQRLEERFGVRLLNRTTRRVSTTEAGRDFHLRCRDIFEQVDEAVQQATNLGLKPRGNLRINAPVAFGHTHLTEALAAFQATYPDINIDLTLNDRFVDIVDEGYDVALRIGRLADSSLITRKLATCRMIACAAPDYLDHAPTLQHPDDLMNHNCLVYTYLAESGGWRFTRDEKAAVVVPTGDFRANSGSAVVSAAVAGRGVILEPSFLTGNALRTGTLVPILKDWHPTALALHAVYPQARLLPQKVRALIDFLADRFSPTPPWDEGLA